MKKTTATVAALAALTILGGCAYPPPGGATYRGYEARGEQSVRFGVVESVRDVKIGPHDTGVGTATGVALGGIAGSNMGRGNGEVVGAIAGAVLGGIIGQHIEKEANERPGLEITVLLDSGKYVAIVQGADEAFKAGDRVRVLSGRGTARVTH